MVETHAGLHEWRLRLCLQTQCNDHAALREAMRTVTTLPNALAQRRDCRLLASESLHLRLNRPRGRRGICRKSVFRRSGSSNDCGRHAMCLCAAHQSTRESCMRPFAILQAVVLAFAVLAAACSPRESSTPPGAAGTTPGAMPGASAASR